MAELPLYCSAFDASALNDFEPAVETTAFLTIAGRTALWQAGTEMFGIQPRLDRDRLRRIGRIGNIDRLDPEDEITLDHDAVDPARPRLPAGDHLVPRGPPRSEPQPGHRTRRHVALHRRHLRKIRPAMRVKLEARQHPVDLT